MRTLLLIFVAVVASVAGIILSYFWSAYHNRQIRARDAARVLKTCRKSKDFIHKLLVAGLGNDGVYSNVAVPVKDKEGNRHIYKMDHVVVNRSGIIVISVRNESGKIDNPFRGDWTYLDVDGGKTEPNPFESNMKFIHALEGRIHRANIYNVPITNLVVFVSKDALFKNSRFVNLLIPEHLIDYIEDMSHNKFLNSGEVRRTKRVIERLNRRPRRQAPPADNTTMPTN